MSLAAEPVETRTGSTVWWCAAAAIVTALAAAALAGWTPIWFSIITVGLFAGPHNWYEFRYFLTRMPARWGNRWWFYTLGLGGVAVLSALFILINVLPSLVELSYAATNYGFSIWNNLLILWLATLIYLRSREMPGRDWFWVYPLALVLCAAAWWRPGLWGMGLVYLHPLVALWFLRREIRRRKSEWLPIYHGLLLLVPLLLGVLWWKLAAAPNLPGDDELTSRIASHAGGTVFSGVSTHFLVAAHTFLEMLHYAVWLAAIPLLTLTTTPWKTERTPLAKKSVAWRWLIRGIVFGGGIAVLLLWGCFLGDYALTRQVYFTVAIGHVLMEFTFLIGAV